MSALDAHHASLKQCTKCPDMIGPVITGHPATSPIIQIGQAPGTHEGKVGKPFGWTAGKTLFQWYASIGVEEAAFREQVYIAAVCRCFPGKSSKGGGDRVPNQTEIETCKPWLIKEFEILQPKLIIPVGKLAITEVMPVTKLVDVIGQQHQIKAYGHQVDVIPLPHPSGASTWHRMPTGKKLLAKALTLLSRHPIWQNTFREQKRQFFLK